MTTTPLAHDLFPSAAEYANQTFSTPSYNNNTIRQPYSDVYDYGAATTNHFGALSTIPMESSHHHHHQGGLSWQSLSEPQDSGHWHDYKTLQAPIPVHASGSAFYL
jgi:hypothetical protein